MKQRYYDREEDDDLELLDPPLILKLLKEGKIKRTSSFLGSTSPRIEPLFRFSSSHSKVVPISEVSIKDENRSSSNIKSESLLKDYDSQLFKLPQLGESQDTPKDTDTTENDSYTEYYETDPFSYMNDTFAFVTQNEPSPLQSNQPSFMSPSQSPVIPQISTPLISPFLAYASDMPITPKITYGGGSSAFGKDNFPSPAFFAAPSGNMMTAMAQDDDELTSAVFKSRSSSIENAHAPTPTASQTPGSVMTPASDHDTNDSDGKNDGNENGENPLSLKYKLFSYYS